MATIIHVAIDDELERQIAQSGVDPVAICNTALHLAINEGDPWWSGPIINELERRNLVPENTRRVLIDICEGKFVEVHATASPKLADVIPAIVQGANIVNHNVDS